MPIALPGMYRYHVPRQMCLRPGATGLCKTFGQQHGAGKHEGTSPSSLQLLKLVWQPRKEGKDCGSRGLQAVSGGTECMRVSQDPPATPETG